MMLRRPIAIVLAAVFLLVHPALGRKKGDSRTVKQLKKDIAYLASDELEGRRTGTEGERKAADYIEKRYNELKIPPFKGQYRHAFQFNYGREIAATTAIRLYNKPCSDTRRWLSAAIQRQ